MLNIPHWPFNPVHHTGLAITGDGLDRQRPHPSAAARPWTPHSSTLQPQALHAPLDRAAEGSPTGGGHRPEEGATAGPAAEPLGAPGCLRWPAVGRGAPAASTAEVSRYMPNGTITP